jgi:hypothetical protein
MPDFLDTFFANWTKLWHHSSTLDRNAQKSMDNVVNIEEILNLAGQLSLPDKVRLLEQIAPQITQDLITSEVTPRKSLLGVWRGLDSIEAEIAEARREMWTNFPRRGG